MSGHAGFQPIGTTSSLSVPVPPPPATGMGEEPKVDGTGTVKGTGATDGTDQTDEPVASGRPAESSQAEARQLVQQLDMLLMRAAQGATQTADAKSVSKALKDLPIDDGARTAIETALDKAKSSLLAINAFSGRELGNAVKLKGGRFNWSSGGAAGAAIKKALDAQAELSVLLRQQLDRTPDDVAADLLEEAIFQCDRRMCEIQTLVCQFADILEKSESIDAETAKRLEAKLSELLPRQALLMHGNDSALAAMKDAVAPLATRLDTFAKDPYLSLSAEDFTALGREISEMSNAIDAAVRTGSVNGAPVDRSLLSTAKGVLTEVSASLSRVRTETASRSMRQFAEKTFGAAPFGVARPKYVPVLKSIAPTLAELVEKREQLRLAAVKYAEDPSGTNWTAVEKAVDEYTGIKPFGLLEELDTLSTYGTYGLGARNDNAIAMSLTNKLGKVVDADRPKNMGDLIKEFASEVKALCEKRCSSGNGDIHKKMADSIYISTAVFSQTKHLKKMSETIEHMGDEKFVTSTTVQSAFQGELKFSTLVEARIHGIQDNDVNPYLDDSNSVSSRTLGSGNVNTVYEVDYADGSTHIFKPEAPGRQAFGFMNLAYDTTDLQMVAELNMASQKTAEALGLDDVMTKTSVGSFDGQFGIFMEKAPGREAVEFAESKGVGADELSASDVRKLPDDQYKIVVGQIMRKANRLDWFDMITGQGDRHSHNYMIRVGKDLSVSLKGIDNDACFPSYRTGLRTFTFTGKYAKQFRDLMWELPRRLFRGNPAAMKEFREAIAVDRGLVNEGDSVTVNAAELDNPEIADCLHTMLGVHSLSMPDYIDKELYDKLMEMNDNPDLRNAFLDELAGHLPEAAREAAEKRLMEAIGHAAYLGTLKDHVLAQDDWETKEVQRAVVGEMPPNIDKNEYTPLKERAHVAPDKSAADSVGLVVTYEKAGYFNRDLIHAIAKPGWFEE